VNAADDEEQKRGRKLPLYLLFVGPRGASLAACKIALRRLPGVELSQFTDPQAALAWANGKNIAAAVVDDNGLPANDGLTFLRHLGAWPGPRPHTILLSDAAQLNAPGAAQALGVDDIVPPSVPRTNLIALLRGAIGLRQAVRASWEQTEMLKDSPAWAKAAPAPQPARVERIAAAVLLLALLIVTALWHPWSPPPAGPAGAPAANGGASGGSAPGTNGGSGAGGNGPTVAGGAGASDGSAGAATNGPVPAAAAAAAGASGAGTPAAAGVPVPADAAGFVVLDETGKTISANAPDVPRAPASTLKVLTAVTALTQLGSGFRFTTKLVAQGTIAGGVLDGTLALVGGGDPVLRATDLDEGVAALARRGVQRISGDLVIDATAFTGPEYNAHWSAADRDEPYAAGTSALSLDEGVHRGVAVLDQAGFVGVFLRHRLVAHHIAIDGSTQFRHAGAPAVSTVVWAHASPPLSVLVTTMIAQSDNHVAEQLVRAIGRSTNGIGSEQAGLDRMRLELSERGVATDGVALYDGSGLSRDDRLTPRALAQLLWSIGRTPAGETIYRALPHVGTQGDIVAKTGRVGDAEGLAGYLNRPPAGSLSFAFLGSGAAGTLQAGQERQLRRLALVADGAATTPLR
jgi:D-alanyl-D-alanine carboxypeptidase/D-alanyl-D-alanine-endopeptidase (penicillin-binding protein 4)